MDQAVAGFDAEGAAGALAHSTTPDMAAAPPLEGLTPRQVLALQGIVGNRVVTSVMRSVAQRVPMTSPDSSETLYNATNPAGQATAGTYGGGVDAGGAPNVVKYDMTRDGDTKVTVTVRIKFLSQARCTVPRPAGAPATVPDLGDLVGRPTEIPANDPDNRRAWATDIAAKAVTVWNGRLALTEGSAAAAPAAAGTVPAAAPAGPAPAGGVTPAAPAAPPSAPPKKLPVTFASVPVFGLGEPEDTRIIVHPMATVAGTPGQPIDAGNYYLNKGAYTGDDKIIAAHEYGHLLGIPDEYSQSNSQLNALIHQAAPGGAPSAGPALDRASVQHMVLNSLKQPLVDKLTASIAPITTAIRAKKAKVKTAMVAATKAGVVDPAVTDELTRMLAARSEGRLAPSVAAAVAFETTRNFSSISVAGGAVEAGFSAAALSTTITDAYVKALTGAETASVAVTGVGNVTVDVAGSVAATTAAGGAQAAPAAAIATNAVTAPGGGAPAAAAAPGLPAIAPPPNLVAQLTALPATWDTAGSLLETGVTPAAFAKAMVATLKSADAAAAVAAAVPLPPGAARRRKAATVGALYQRAYRLVQGASQNAAAQVGADLVGETVKPTLTASVTQLMTTIDTEVKRIMVTPPSGVAALGTPDPNMTAMVNAMKARLDANKAATAGNPGRDPMGPSGTGSAPAQDVTYSYEGLMGSSTTRALRSDQFEPIVKNFNDKLRTPGEQTFKADVK